MEKDWILLYSTDKMYQAEMIKEILSQHNIESVIINKKDSAYLIGEAEVYVHKDNEATGKDLLNQFEE